MREGVNVPARFDRRPKDDAAQKAVRPHERFVRPDGPRDGPVGYGFTVGGDARHQQEDRNTPADC